MSLLLEPIINVANVSTILLSTFTKVPQIMSVVRARSVKGLSIPSILLELTGYCITMSYFIANQYSLPTYLEYPTLVLQDAVLVALIVWLGAAGLVTMAGYGGVLLALVAAMVMGVVTDQGMTMLINCATPISAISKIVQLAAIVSKRSSQGISTTTWMLSVYTCLARMLTIYVATADVALMISFSISLVLNVAVVSATLYYAPPAAASAVSNKRKLK